MISRAILGGLAPALIALSAACSRSDGASSGAPAAFADTQAGSAATSQSTSGSSSFDLCRIIPFDTVAQILRTTVGRSVTASTSRPNGTCTYSDTSEGAAPVSVSIDIGRDRSAAVAGVAFLAAREQLGSHGTHTTDVPDLGDAAFGTSDTAGRYAVSAQKGVVTEHVVVAVSNVEADSLRPAAIELARRTLAALH